jgi:hypothetical protein
MSSDPVSRLEMVRGELDRVFGDGYAREHPDLVAVVVQSAASDWAAARLASAIEHVAFALAVDEDAPANGSAIVRAHGVLRP